MNDFENRTDEELITSLYEKNADIEEYLLEKYKPLVRKIAKTDAFKISGGDHEDLLQEGMIGLMKAVKNYDPRKGASFFTFAALCIRGQMINAVEASNRDKNIALNSYISLYESTGEGGDAKLMDSVDELMTRSVEDVVIDIATARELDRRIHMELSDFEVRVYEMHMAGMEYSEIAKQLGKEKKSIDNAIQRIKKKVREILKL
ncbi:MAG TPA: RNA polymerase subunit sigma-70 [Lachnospiraceae bacterium]|nr:sigma-70 family RNA polymerase sigma factor [Lachnospiraceae bacterium]HAV01308.1 RNA polymerase subunit sigma-70 [Lachnospiraceae bacterium]